MSDICLVRQPVFGSKGALIGYEIRFGASQNPLEALIQSFLNGTFDVVRGGYPAFVACSPEQMIDNAFDAIDPATAILMLPRTARPEPELFEAIERFLSNGGHIALDELSEVEAPSEALLPYARWVRVDVRSEDPTVIGRVCDRLAERQPGVKIMAFGIEELSQYELALEMGVDAFQGTFFSSPEPVPATELPQSTVAAMRLMGLARDPNVNDRKLEDVLATDPVLTFQLLRLVNSAAVGMRGVSSLGQALRLIGRNAFQRWLAVAVAASRKSSTGVDQELVRQAVERGRLLEQLGGSAREPGTLFLVGLFSLLDAVFRMTLPEILERVALSDEANSALLDRSGPYADALAFAESYELGMFENATEIAREMGIDPAGLGEFYTNALTWTNEALGSLLEAQAPPATAGRR
jgi:EAL and modified HD-GYP domain-containing signal transduction protein